MTKTNTVTDKQHARLSASGADWWTNCPGGPALCEGLIEVPSSFAAEGTAAHSLGERCLRDGRDPAEFIGEEIKVGEFTFEVDDEMAEGVQTYLDAVEPFCAPGWEWDIEVAFDDLADLHPDLGGTGDFVACNEKAGHLVVVDFKYGKNISVDPKENFQLLDYGLGAVRRHHNRGVSLVSLVVVQPRDKNNADAVRRWDTDGIYLLEWSNDLIAAAKRTEDPNAPRVTGEWCRFCKAAAICPEAQARALAAAQAEFQTDGSVTAPNPEKFTADQLGQALKAASYLETWVNRVHEFAHAQATAGVMPSGFKLVAKRAFRKWKNEDDAFKFLRTRLKRDEIYVEKLKSPAQIEPLVAEQLDGKTKKARIAAFADLAADLVEKKSSGTVLAPLDDKRPAVTFAAVDEFQSQPTGMFE